MVAAWFAAGVLYHLAGYGMNSLEDWRAGFDKEDPHKQHHPLHSGTLSESSSSLVVYSLFVAAVVYAIVLARFNVLAVVVISLGVMSGVAYNLLAKGTVFKPVPIAIAHTTMFVTPYVALGGALESVTFLLGVVYMLFWVAFQIGISGEIKDLEDTGEYNVLEESFGLKTWEDMYNGETHITNTKTTQRVATWKRVVLALCGCLVVAFSYHNLSLELGYVALCYSFPMALSMVLILPLTKQGPYNRNKRIKNMANIEMLTLISFVAMYLPIYGFIPGSLFVTGSAAWVLTFNQLEWGTWLAPEV